MPLNRFLRAAAKTCSAVTIFVTKVTVNYILCSELFIT